MINKELEQIFCTECGEYNDLENSYCIHCGHKLKKINKQDINYKEYCTICGEIIDKNAKYCPNCEYEVIEIEKISICPVCGEWRDDEKFCANCGHKKDNEPRYNNPLQRGKNLSVLEGDKFTKECFNCGKMNPKSYNYCRECGEKLK